MCYVFHTIFGDGTSLCNLKMVHIIKKKKIENDTKLNCTNLLAYRATVRHAKHAQTS